MKDGKHRELSERFKQYLYAPISKQKRRIDAFGVFHDSQDVLSKTITTWHAILLDRRFEPPILRSLSPHEIQRLQGFPLDWTSGVGETTQRKLLGNAVCSRSGIYFKKMDKELITK